MLHFEKIISYLHLELKMWFEQLWNLNLIQYSIQLYLPAFLLKEQTLRPEDIYFCLISF